MSFRLLFNFTSGPAAQLQPNAAGQQQPQAYEATPGFMEVDCWVEDRDLLDSEKERCF